MEKKTGVLLQLSTTQWVYKVVKLIKDIAHNNNNNGFKATSRLLGT